MMKKTMIAVAVMMLAGVSSLFGASIWDLEDVAKIDAATHKNSKGENIAYSDDVKKLLKALIGKNATNTSYDELKAIVKPYETKNNSRFIQIVIGSKRFSDYVPNLIKDSEQTNHINRSYLTNKKIFQLLDKKDWRNRAAKSFENKANTNQALRCAKIVNFYQKNTSSFTDAELKEDMKFFKRIAYPKIGVSDDWKQLVVKIELMLKSLE